LEGRRGVRIPKGRGPEDEALSDSTEKVAGYSYGEPDVALSPISMAELMSLKVSAGFTEEDERLLRCAGQVLADQTEAIVRHWRSGIIASIPHLARHSRTPDGQPIPEYLAKSNLRFQQWIVDTCTRPYDQDWLNYQHEIALRHTTAKKNQTDKVDSTAYVPLADIVAFVAVMNETIKPYLAAKGHTAEEVDAMHFAWCKSMQLQMALWVRAYITWPTTSIHRVEADGVNVFYREAGPAGAPVVLLLHGFPTSSVQYRELMSRLADRYRVIAPDLPGFGFTEIPQGRNYHYSFEALAKTMEAFTDTLELEHYALYVFDYGAPTGFRLAMAQPERVTAIVSQNGNAYEEGLGDAWAPIRRYWSEPTTANREAIRAGLNAEGLRREYGSGIADASEIRPESFTLDAALLARPGNIDIQLDLFLDYANNVKLYPKFQAYFRTSQPPLLAIWGKNDPFFIPAGAEAFKRDLPQATVQFLDTGHFALETHVNEVAEAIRKFLHRELAQ
jgi:pimeloyl-ACP methyl ester carboxylesterase